MVVREAPAAVRQRAVLQGVANSSLVEGLDRLSHYRKLKGLLVQLQACHDMVEGFQLQTSPLFQLAYAKRPAGQDRPRQYLFALRILEGPGDLNPSDQIGPGRQESQCGKLGRR